MRSFKIIALFIRPPLFHKNSFRLRGEAEDLKKKFTDHLNKSSAYVNQLSEEMLSIIADLEISYISATDLADRRSDKRLLKEYDDMSAKLTQMSCDIKYETKTGLRTPYLHTGTYKNSLPV